MPPKVQRSPNWPKTYRKREVDEPPAHKRRFIVCYKFYGVIGHNRKCCPADPTNVHKKIRNILVRQWLNRSIFCISDISFHLCSNNNASVVQFLLYVWRNIGRHWQQLQAQVHQLQETILVGTYKTLALLPVALCMVDHFIVILA